MTKPLTINVFGSLLLTNCARPTVPPAPGMFVTWTFLAAPEATSADCIERAVWSHPPPGAAGAISFSSPNCANAELAIMANNPAAMVPETSLLKRDIGSSVAAACLGRECGPAATFDYGDTVAPFAGHGQPRRARLFG
jgi:hypothetical protein